MSFRARGGPLGKDRCVYDRRQERTLQPRPSPSTRLTADLIVGPVAAADVPALCERLRLLVGPGGVELVTCHVGALVPDLVAVDALCRLQLAARARGCRVQLRHASHGLEALLDLCGLRDVLPCDALRLEPSRQTEPREQPS